MQRQVVITVLLHPSNILTSKYHKSPLSFFIAHRLSKFKELVMRELGLSSPTSFSLIEE